MRNLNLNERVELVSECKVISYACTVLAHMIKKLNTNSVFRVDFVWGQRGVLKNLQRQRPIKRFLTPSRAAERAEVF